MSFYFNIFYIFNSVIFLYHIFLIYLLIYYRFLISFVLFGSPPIHTVCLGSCEGAGESEAA